MKILCLTPWFPSHPQEQHGNFILDSVTALIADGHEVHVLVTEPWKLRRKKIFSYDFNVISCRYISLPRAFLLSFSLWAYKYFTVPILEKMIKKNKYQLIHAHTEIAGLAAVTVGRRLKVPTIITLHGISTEKKLYRGIAKKQLYECTLSAADRVVLVGHSLQDFFKAFIKKYDHFRVVPNGFRIYPEKNNSIGRNWHKKYLNFISVSNLDAGKGIDITLRALAQVKQMGLEHWKYTIIGAGRLRKTLEALVAILGLQQQVFFFGACKHREVYQQLDQADIFVLPSYREAFGVAYLEAMSQGLLTIGVRGQGPQDFILHSKTGLLIPPRDVSALVNTLHSVFLQREWASEMAQAGRVYVNQHFTWACHARKLADVYEENFNLVY